MSISINSGRHFISPTYLIGLLGLLFCVFIFQYAGATQRHKGKRKRVENTMTVAAIRTPGNNETFIRITFLQSQRFFKLPNDANPAYLNLLKESEKDNTPVIVKRAKEESDVILSVRKP